MNIALLVLFGVRVREGTKEVDANVVEVHEDNPLLVCLLACLQRALKPNL